MSVPLVSLLTEVTITRQNEKLLCHSEGEARRIPRIIFPWSLLRAVQQGDSSLTLGMTNLWCGVGVRCFGINRHLAERRGRRSLQAGATYRFVHNRFIAKTYSLLVGNRLACSVFILLPEVIGQAEWAGPFPTNVILDFAFFVSAGVDCGGLRASRPTARLF